MAVLTLTLLIALFFFAWPESFAQELRKKILNFIAHYRVTRRARNLIFYTHFFLIFVLVPHIISLLSGRELLVRSISRYMFEYIQPLEIYIFATLYPRAVLGINWVWGYVRFALM